jgi:hypothetical protein
MGAGIKEKRLTKRAPFGTTLSSFLQLSWL